MYFSWHSSEIVYFCFPPFTITYHILCIPRFVVLMASLNLEESLANALSTLGSSHLQLKEEQKKAVQAICEGRDVFVWLPTGFGKSLCYQLLPTGGYGPS